ncbi:succinate dehydrogenase assembly factor 2, mitochondrial isoform X2 [Octopus bimaculoides]|uniref:Succinate dehydrogenase assembly factor 2, mitochondrial n=1 Tax=Octopus bimaculoides TaxID=37653 RepID=A0A0L8HKA4_OCTBM|nr:succinate dehydrogenase assembly factor 2, mitochondrial isoform X2 [Octopus bimaculoides]|eukprot:XP_014771660.1 PREDICTED: succinate dehydrogenase assembly factor 2, mitochondrial-like [Octopus bimaculoides]
MAAMLSSSLFRNTISRRCSQCQAYVISKCLGTSTDGSDHMSPPLPPTKEYKNETPELRRARLLYQSRKRGMLENGLILSTFASKYLKDLNEQQLMQYDTLINEPTNDWDIYYWITGTKPTPDQFNNEIMQLLKEFVKNDERASRLKQPDL